MMLFTVSTTFNGIREVCTSNKPDPARSLVFGSHFRAQATPAPLTFGQAVAVAFDALTNGGRKTRIHAHRAKPTALHNAR